MGSTGRRTCRREPPVHVPSPRATGYDPPRHAGNAWQDDDNARQAEAKGKGGGRHQGAASREGWVPREACGAEEDRGEGTIGRPPDPEARC